MISSIYVLNDLYIQDMMFILVRDLEEGSAAAARGWPPPPHSAKISNRAPGPRLENLKYISKVVPSEVGRCNKADAVDVNLTKL